MHFSEGLDDFWTFFSVSLTFFWPALSHFWPYLGLYMAIFGTKIGSFLGDFRPFLGRSSVILGSLWIILASFSHHSGVVLVSVWPDFWGHFWTIFDPFYGHLRFLVMSWDVDCSIKQDAQEKHRYANFCQNSPKLCKIVQKQAFFSPIRHMFLL